MQFVPYLNFSGQCREAFDFYHRVLGGELVAMISHGDMGIPGLDEQSKSLIMHARLIVGDAVLMASDVTGEIAPVPAPVQVSLLVDSVEEAERVFSAFSEGGTVMMPLEKQDWAERFGFLSDRFGIPWMITFENPQQM
jgi:PhnB protein